MVIPSFTRFFAVASLNLFAGLLIQQQPVAAASSTVGITISEVTPEMQAKAAEYRALEAEIHDAWLAIDFTDESPVEVKETINGQTQHYWEYADGTISQIAPSDIQDVTTTVPDKPAKKAHVKNEEFKPMPSIAVIKQLTFDWTSAQVMQPLEKMIAQIIL